jgi:hypothetical protein
LTGSVTFHVATWNLRRNLEWLSGVIKESNPASTAGGRREYRPSRLKVFDVYARLIPIVPSSLIHANPVCTLPPLHVVWSFQKTPWESSGNGILGCLCTFFDIHSIYEREYDNAVLHAQRALSFCESQLVMRRSADLCSSISDGKPISDIFQRNKTGGHRM